MNPLRSLAIVLLGCLAPAHAFTLDAVGYDGGTLTDEPVSIAVPGYGELIFEATPGSSLVVNSAYQYDNGFGGPSLNFDANDAVKITFSGTAPDKVNFSFVGVSTGESFVVEKDLFSPQVFRVSLQGGDDGAGLHTVGWEAVPEPAASLFGLFGAVLLMVRRRR